MNGKTNKVAYQYEFCLTPPKNIDDWRNQRDNGYAQIGKKRLFVAYRRKPQAVEQGADADGREN